jgi:hypothetical protein
VLFFSYPLEERTAIHDLLNNDSMTGALNVVNNSDLIAEKVLQPCIRARICRSYQVFSGFFDRFLLDIKEKDL